MLKVCAVCSSAFEAKSRKRVYCSIRCSSKRQNERERAAGLNRRMNHPGVCLECRAEFMGKPGQGFCRKGCATAARNHPGTAIVRYVRPRVWLGSRSVGTVWVQGACVECGDSFVVRGAAARYCSKRCGDRWAWRRKGLARGHFYPSLGLRTSVYERDGHTCQICFGPVDYSADPTSDWHPSLDHIVPRSKGGSDGADNLRTAHRWCNAVRGDERYYTDADLRTA